MKTKKTVIIAFEIDGYHNYPYAPEEVDFLRDRHRHSFGIKIHLNNPDREREIFIQREEAIFYLTESYGSPCEFDSMSCEMIAEELLSHFSDDGARFVEVWEEKTGGARVEKSKK